jgi:hypothetical protein
MTGTLSHPASQRRFQDVTLALRQKLDLGTMLRGDRCSDRCHLQNRMRFARPRG